MLIIIFIKREETKNKINPGFVEIDIVNCSHMDFEIIFELQLVFFTIYQDF